MKKAQVLSAIALAFALGLTVVAPVANTYAVEARAAGTFDKTSTEAQVVAAIKAVNTPTYNKIAALEAAIEAAYTDADGEVQTTVQTVAVATAQTDVIDALNAINTAISAEAYAKGTNETLSTTVSNAEKVENYSKYVTLFDAVANNKTSVTDDTKLAELVAAITAIAPNYNPGKNMTLAEAKIDAAKVPNYALYNTLVGKIKIANNTIEVEKDLRETLVNAGKGSVDVAAKKTVAGLVTMAEGYLATEGVKDYADLYEAVKAADDAVKAGTTATASTDNTDLISAIEAAYKKATGNGLTITTPSDPVTPTDPTDPSTTTTIESADGSVSVKGELQAGLVVEAKEAEEKDEMFKKAFGDKKFFVYDIKIKGQNGYVTTFDKDVTVTVKVPEGINGAKAGVYYVNAEGSASKIASTYNAEAKTLTFTTNHFSYYAIVEDNGVNVSDSGVLAAADGTASSTVAIVAGIATALTAAGAGVVAYRNARRAGKEA